MKYQTKANVIAKRKKQQLLKNDLLPSYKYQFTTSLAYFHVVRHARHIIQTLVIK